MKPRYIDIHAHVNFAAYAEDSSVVIERALTEEVWVINVGTQYDTSRDAVKLAQSYQQGIFSVVGLHPVHTSRSFHDQKELGEGGDEFTSRGEVFDAARYKEFFKDKKVVGIGECGLDYYHLTPETVKKQKDAFEAQIALAGELGVPLMLHIRNGKEGNAYQDALEILKSAPKARGNVHFFAGDWPTARQFLDIGFTLSFTGVVTFTHDYDEVVKAAPLDMIMSETDSPYITPVPYRGKRNEPIHVREVVKKIAQVRQEDQDVVEQALVENAFRVFGLGWK